MRKGLFLSVTAPEIQLPRPIGETEINQLINHIEEKIVVEANQIINENDYLILQTKLAGIYLTLSLIFITGLYFIPINEKINLLGIHTNTICPASVINCNPTEMVRCELSPTNETRILTNWATLNLINASYLAIISLCKNLTDAGVCSYGGYQQLQPKKNVSTFISFECSFSGINGFVIFCLASLILSFGIKTAQKVFEVGKELKIQNVNNFIKEFKKICKFTEQPSENTAEADTTYVSIPH